MAQAAKRTIAVFGATGQQGGSVIRYLQKHAASEFQIRGLTRNPQSEKAQALAASGVEVVQADQNGDVSALTSALNGVYGVFAVTNFWDPATGSKEEEIGKKVVDAAKSANVEHFIYSGLVNANKLSNQKYTVIHFDMKARIVEYARAAGFQYFTNVEPACYIQNFLSIMAPQPNEDGTEVLTIGMSPDSKLSLIDITMYGGPVTAAFKNPESFNNADVLFQTDYLTPTEMADAFTEAKGKTVQLQTVPPLSEGFKSAVGEEMSQMFAWFDEFGYYGPETDTRKLNSGIEALRALETEYAKLQGKDDSAAAQYASAQLQQGTLVEVLKRELK